MNIGRSSHLFDLVLLTHSFLRHRYLDSAVGLLLGGDDGLLRVLDVIRMEGADVTIPVHFAL